jgi:hypothetical protein
MQLFRKTAIALMLLTAALVHAQSPLDPIPLQDEEANFTPYIGSAATPNPIEMPFIPQNPFMAANGLSNMHHDTYMSDVYHVPGPLGNSPTVISASLGMLCPSMAFPDETHILGACLNLDVAQLVLIDRQTLEPLATLALPTIEVDTMTDFPAGSYFYLSEQNHVLIPTIERTIWEVALVDTGFEQVRVYDLRETVPESTAIQSVLPDFDGLLWFVTTDGLVGAINPADDAISSIQLDGEAIVNSFAADETGGVFIVSSHALYRFDAGSAGEPLVTWREAYDRGTQVKPGQADQGSGTTPTLMGQDLIVITDNAEPRMNVLVYQRAAQVEGERLVCAVPVFGEGQSSTENSLIATNRSIIVENNYGYTRPLFALEATSERGGMARIDVNPDGSCETIWTNDEIVPSVVSKMSTETGLIYTYTKDESQIISGAWYFTAIDFETGEVVFRQLTGNGLLYNNHYASLYIGPDGEAYIPVIGGIVSIRDGG